MNQNNSEKANKQEHLAVPVARLQDVTLRYKKVHALDAVKLDICLLYTSPSPRD